MDILKINRNYKNFARLVKIASIIGKYGFSTFLHRIRAGLTALPERIFKIKQETELARLTEPERVRLAIEELGPAFIKMGQIFSLRPDLIPPEYAKELEKLQDKAPPVSFSKIKKLLEDEYGSPVNEIFSSIDEEPEASGSLAQVHRAILNKEKHTVALKVLKPGTQAIVERDLSIIQLLTRLAVRYIPELRIYNPIQVIQDFSDILRNELNLQKEAATMERFSHFFDEGDSVHIPRVFREYTTKGVLVMEYIRGIKVTDVEKLDMAGMDRKKIAENGACLAMKALFEYGFFHADPHPGNIFIIPGNVVVPVDFGITGYIDEEGVWIIGNILLSLLNRDPDKIIHYLQRYDFLDEDIDARRLKIDLLDLMDISQDTTLSKIDVPSQISAIFNLTRKYRLRFPSEYFLIFKTLLEVDGVGRKLYPDFNVAKAARPYAQKWYISRLDPRRYGKDILYLLDDLVYLIKLLPMEFVSIIKKIRFGKLKLPIYHENLEKAVSELDRIGNRLSFSVIIASLLLSSSILIQAKIGPVINGYPVLGLLGFFTAAVMGIWLLIGIIRSGRL